MLYFVFWWSKKNKKNIVFTFRSKITSPAGIRLVELRSDPEGIVFHHWEFLKETPPARFVLMLSSVKNIPTGASVVTVLAEDTLGNITRRKVKIEDFQK